eukprot:jgi/Chlat1/1974/Chrsp158S02275
MAATAASLALGVSSTLCRPAGRRASPQLASRLPLRGFSHASGVQLASQRRRQTRMSLMGPLLSIVSGEVNPRELVESVTISNWDLSEESIKSFYMVFAAMFSWGCLVFASTTDPFYDNPESGYERDGGDGTQYWFYEKADEAEENERKELLDKITNSQD